MIPYLGSKISPFVCARIMYCVNVTDYIENIIAFILRIVRSMKV